MEMTNLTDINAVRCVLVGDRSCGKTRMLKKYAAISGASYDSESGQVVTAFNGHKCVFMDSWMSSKVSENAHVVLLCVSVACKVDVEEVVEIALDTMIDRTNNVPFVLVGTQIEKRLRNMDISGGKSREYTMPLHRAEPLAKRIGAIKYLECSEITGEGIEEVFEDAFEIGYKYAVEQQNASHQRKPPSKNIVKRIRSCIMQ